MDQAKKIITNQAEVARREKTQGDSEELTTTRKQNKVLTAGVSKMKEQVGELKNTITEMKKERTVGVNRIRKLETDLEKRKTELEEKKREMTEDKKARKTAGKEKERVKELEDEIAGLKITSNREISKEAARRQKSELEAGSLVDQVNTLTAQNRSLMDQVKSLQEVPRKIFKKCRDHETMDGCRLGERCQ